MNQRRVFSLARLWAMVVKEFIQMRRDRLTFGMMVGIPLLQLILFGFAINSDPKHLPAAVLLADNGPFGRTLLYAMRNSAYFDFVRQVQTESEAQRALALGEVQFVVNIPENFTRDLLAKNQRQAMQMAFFFFLPSLLLSGFMFPFRGMPGWAQVIGEGFPLTHFLRIVRGIVLKGNGLEQVGREAWPIALFTAIVLTIGVLRYRRTLD